jgi:hypothetical protein
LPDLIGLAVFFASATASDRRSVPICGRCTVKDAPNRPYAVH